MAAPGPLQGRHVGCYASRVGVAMQLHVALQGLPESGSKNGGTLPLTRVSGTKMKDACTFRIILYVEI
jgi:hypothetical protein